MTFRRLSASALALAVLCSPFTPFVGLLAPATAHAAAGWTALPYGANIISVEDRLWSLMH